jgi:Tol biopolymer transport system component
MPEIGRTIAHYQILEKLGVGGMGEVYRARDTQLNRDVALKVLPADFAMDPDRLARFQREAQVLATFNHPHIAQIYGLADAEGVRALAMELVEGPTLADRIARGPVPIEEALPLAQQLAEALEYAHERGIVHRDLKPANIKITPDGSVKVLDFGLAKALESGPSGADLTHSPTLTSPLMTRAGVILGTAAYMAPEQARGAAVDKRADIWAFGVVLFEILTGRACFTGDSVTDVLAAVVRAEPDWAALSADTPWRVRDLLHQCLAKDRKRRLRDIADAWLDIEDAMSRGSLGASADEPSASPPRIAGVTRRQKLAWTMLGVALAAVVTAGLVLSGVWPRARSSGTPPLRVSIIHTEGSEVGAPAISPDGHRVAYGARRADGMPVLWVRDLASGEARPLKGTEGAALPFWSPDSRDLGFTANFLKRVPADGGPVQVITEKAANRGGAWAPDGTIVFSAGDSTPLYRINAAPGSTAAPLTKLQGGDWSHCWPSFLPDGRRFLFAAKLWSRSAETSEQGIYLESLDSPEIRRLLPDLSSAVYAPPGYLVFVRDGILTAAPFDLATGRVGQPAPVGGAVAVDNVYYLSGISAATDGTLAVRPPPAVSLLGSSGSAAFTAELRLVDRTGMGSAVGTVQSFTYYMALSPDNRRVAAQINDPGSSTSDLWLVDLQGGNKRPLTTTHGWAGAPVWSADGTRLAYAYQPPGQIDDVCIMDLRSGQREFLIQTPAIQEHPVAWSHDGICLILYTFDEKHGRTLSAWSFRSRSLTPFAEGGTHSAVFSPDDRYVAFSSRESGREEVYVTTFPERHQTWPLTTEGGRVLSWRADGREILVASLSGHVVAYPVSTEGGFSVSQPTVLVRDVGFAAPYSTATRDHSHILIRASPDAAKDKGEIRLLFGWTDAFRQGKPPQRP